MTFMKYFLTALAFTGLALPQHLRAADFDFYVLSLSWSPSWCATNRNSSNSRQCDPRENFGFIVHGLWPQNEHGYPQYCPTRLSDRVPSQLGKRYLDIIPSMGLIGHEWRKHGTCSGLDQTGYFAKVREAYELVQIPPVLETLAKGVSASPDAVEKAFIAANKGLPRDAIAVTCSGKMIEEVRICFDKSLNFRACAEVDRSACRLPNVKIPPIP